MTEKPAEILRRAAKLLRKDFLAPWQQAVADWLDDEATEAEFDTAVLTEVAPYLEDDAQHHRHALAVAYLGEARP